MGAVSFSCLNGACTHDTKLEYSEVLSATGEAELDVSEPVDAPGTPKASRLREFLNKHSSPRGYNALAGGAVDHVSTPDSGSPQSVLSTISPTKDRQSPSRNHRQDVDKLTLRSFHSQSGRVGTWPEVAAYIREGDLSQLKQYGVDYSVDINEIRFQEKHRTALHLAVLHCQQHIIQHLIEHGANISLRDDDGKTAVAMAYEGGNVDIINMLTRAKACEFAGSPYSPYALSIASTAHSAQSRGEMRRAQSEALPEDTLETGSLRSVPSVHSLHSEPQSLDWVTPRSRAESAPGPRGALPRVTVNTPVSAYRGNLTPRWELLRSPIPVHTAPAPVPAPDSVQRRMLQVTESLDRIGERQRAFSLPASSPVFQEITHSRSPSEPVQLTLPASQATSVDNTPTEGGSSPRSTITGGEGSSRPPLDKQKTRKPFGKRFRQAAGRAIALIVPSRGLPPRPPSAASDKAGSSAATAASGITTLETAGEDTDAPGLFSWGKSSPESKSDLEERVGAHDKDHSYIAAAFKDN